MKKTIDYKAMIARSDARIREAIKTLSSHDRGKRTLADFRQLTKGPAMGLDCQGMGALLVLMKEWSTGRRDFLDTLPAEDEMTTLKLGAEYGFRCGEKGMNLEETLESIDHSPTTRGRRTTATICPTCGDLDCDIHD